MSDKGNPAVVKRVNQAVHYVTERSRLKKRVTIGKSSLCDKRAEALRDLKKCSESSTGYPGQYKKDSHRFKSVYCVTDKML